MARSKSQRHAIVGLGGPRLEMAATPGHRLQSLSEGKLVGPLLGVRASLISLRRNGNIINHKRLDHVRVGHMGLSTVRLVALALLAVRAVLPRLGATASGHLGGAPDLSQQTLQPLDGQRHIAAQYFGSDALAVSGQPGAALLNLILQITTGQCRGPRCSEVREQLNNPSLLFLRQKQQSPQQLGPPHTHSENDCRQHSWSDSEAKLAEAVKRISCETGRVEGAQTGHKEHGSIQEWQAEHDCRPSKLHGQTQLWAVRIAESVVFAKVRPHKACHSASFGRSS
mmetsp:Transcript_81363/g.186122  ORF Transcript_81363/g.186122 Transcript_81363/m.186122 type:complete len:283 (-) Transcript_81363:976-1824(-)